MPWPSAEPILEACARIPTSFVAAQPAVCGGSKKIIGDIDFLVSSKSRRRSSNFLRSKPGILNVIAKGDTKASVMLEGGIQADLRVVSDAEFPFALMYFTGSKEHNIVMRQRAIQRGLRLNEYGLFQSEEETRDPKLLDRVQNGRGNFREARSDLCPAGIARGPGRIRRGGKGHLPRLIEWTELKGSLHNHSNWSDGRCTHRRNRRSTCRNSACEYWAITDHSKSSFQANGLDAAKAARTDRGDREASTRSSRDEGSDFRLLTGSEVDILTDGKLDFEDDLLAELDVVVASVHHSFQQSEAEMTKRILRAAENPYVHILGHLTGRLLLEREAYKVNQHAIIDACAETGTWIELNANPYRFDMDWRLWHYAKNKGVKCVINCDAHHNSNAGFLRLGAGIARKAGWRRAT